MRLQLLRIPSLDSNAFYLHCPTCYFLQTLTIVLLWTLPITTVYLCSDNDLLFVLSYPNFYVKRRPLLSLLRPKQLRLLLRYLTVYFPGHVYAYSHCVRYCPYFYVNWWQLLSLLCLMQLRLLMRYLTLRITSATHFCLKYLRLLLRPNMLLLYFVWCYCVCYCVT